MDISGWIKRFKKYPRIIVLNEGTSKEKVREYARKKNLYIPESYKDFLVHANGASLFYDRVQLWEMPVDGFEHIPSWKSMEYMNSENVKKRIPYAEDVFLVGGNDIGDFVGIFCKDKECKIVYISPELDKRWEYDSLGDWLENMWEVWHEQ